MTREMFKKFNGYPQELENLTLFSDEKLTKEETEIFNKAYRKVRNKTYMKNCFLNSLQLSMADTTNTIKVVEGYAFKYIPMEHGWNIINGKLIDITFNISDGEKPYLGTFPEDVAYYGHIFNDLDLKEWYKFAKKYDEFSILGGIGREFLETYSK